MYGVGYGSPESESRMIVYVSDVIFAKSYTYDRGSPPNKYQRVKNM